MKIVVGYDGSNSSKEALRVARRHALAFKAAVDIVTSMEKGTEQEQQAIEDAERGLEWAKTMFEEQKVACRTHLLIRGMAPGEDLVDFARENQAAQVVQAHGLGRVAPPGDTAAFLRAAHELSDNPALRSTLGAAARAYAERHFQIGPIADRFEMLLK